MQRIKLSPDELKCLRFVASHRTSNVSEIASALNISKVQMSRIVSDLVDKGFVSTKKQGLSKNIPLSETKHATLWRSLSMEFGHMPLHLLLSGGSLETLSVIDSQQVANRKDIAENSLISEATVARVLTRLGRLGVIERRGFYRISPRFQILAEFTEEFRRYINQKVAFEFAPDAMIVWERNMEFILESSRTEESDGFLATGVSAFARFGVSLMVTKFYFFHSPFARKLRLEEVIIHSLLIPNFTLLPILLVWRKNDAMLDFQYLRDCAEKYKVAASVTEIIRYFESEGRQKPDQFPLWNEFLAKAKEYEIQ